MAGLVLPGSNQSASCMENDEFEIDSTMLTVVACKQTN
jgi:hypothetical protein